MNLLDNRKQEPLKPCRQGAAGYLKEAVIFPEDGIIELVIPVEGDHPMLITIDFLKQTYDVEGVD